MAWFPFRLLAALFMVVLAPALAGCSVVLPLFGVPAHAARRTPPSRIEQRAEKEKDPAPDVTLTTTGGPITVARHEAALAVFFFRGHWCPNCRGQLKELNAQLPRLDDLGVRLVGVSADEADQPPKLKKRLELGFDLAADPDRVAINAFGVLDEENEIAWPALFVIDDGRILYRWIAKDKNKRKEAAEILDDIEEALR